MRRSIHYFALAGNLLLGVGWLQTMEASGVESALTPRPPCGNQDLRAVQDPFWGDPRAPRLPLDVESAGEFDYDGLRMRRIRYTGSTWQGRPQRVYAIYAHPAGEGPFPAVLQIHGGGQTAYAANVAWFVRRGYACLAFDWTGPRDHPKRG